MACKRDVNNFTAFVLLQRGTPSAATMKLLKDRGITSVFYKGHNLAKARQLILDCDLVVYYQHAIDEYVRVLLAWARDEQREVITIEWVKKNIAVQ